MHAVLYVRAIILIIIHPTAEPRIFTNRNFYTLGVTNLYVNRRALIFMLKRVSYTFKKTYDSFMQAKLT